MKPKDKFYFALNDVCAYFLSTHLLIAKELGHEEIQLYEAVVDEKMALCDEVGFIVEKSECNQKNCEIFTNGGANGFCKHREKHYNKGKLLKFKVE